MVKPAVAVMVALCGVVTVFAEAPPPTPPIALHRAAGPITMDGDLSDPGWQGAATIDRFYETSPGDNIPAKVKTVAYLTYDDLDLVGDREWLNAHGARVYAATVERLKTTYSFSAKSLVRVIGQYVTTNREPALYTFPVSHHSGQFNGSVLYSYKLNWQTVLFLGYGDDRILTAQNDLFRADRSLFFKVSYAIQR